MELIMNKLYNDDCLQVLKTLEKESIDLVLCDPPYRCTSRGEYLGTTMSGFIVTENGKNGNGGFKHNDLKIDDYMPLLYRVMKEEAHGYIMTNDLNLIDFHLAIKRHGFNIFKTLIWSKNTVVANPWYMNCHEYIIFFRKGKAKMINSASSRTVLSCKNPTSKIHPSQKPINLLKILISNSSIEGDLVLDFAMGSGSTGMACKELKRGFIGIELDSEHFQKAEERIENHSWQLSLF